LFRDAPTPLLARGSSGSPVLDREGRVIGVNTNRLQEGFYQAIAASDELTKRIADLPREADASRLRRHLGPMGLVALGIGMILGAGLFSLTGIAAAENAGPAVTLSFVIAALGAPLPACATASSRP